MQKVDLPIALILGGVGLAALGFVFSESTVQGWYARRLEDLQVSALGFAVPYAWVLAAAICIALIGMYLLFARPGGSN